MDEGGALMRTIRNIMIIVLIAGAGLYFWNQSEPDFKEQVKHEAVEKMNVLQSKVAPEQSVSNIPLEGDLYSWIGKSEEDLLEAMGEPERKDLSAYNYKWWVYTDHAAHYVQFGIEDHTVKTVYAVGEGLKIEPVAIGQAYDQLNDEFTFGDEVNYTKEIASYTFKMTAEDVAARPLVKLTDDIFLQLYFDTFTNELSSIRVMDADVLLRQRPYEVTYRGTLPPEPDLTDAEWRQVEAGMEHQIFDNSNVLRNRFDKEALEWEDTVSEVAFNHSKDMFEQNYFSHYSLNGDGLKERLDVTGLFYIAAGENIAAQYPDAPAAVEGWLNSEGHREALLTDEYTHLGVGVYRLYYTQNFLAKPM